MLVTESKLRNIIKEEYEKLVKEVGDKYAGGRQSAAHYAAGMEKIPGRTKSSPQSINFLGMDLQKGSEYKLRFDDKTALRVTFKNMSQNDGVETFMFNTPAGNNFRVDMINGKVAGHTYQGKNINIIGIK